MNRYLRADRLILTIYIAAVPFMAIASVFFCFSLKPITDAAVSGSFSQFLYAAAAGIFWALMDNVAQGGHKLIREKLRVVFVSGLRQDVYEGIMRKSVSSFNTATVPQYVSMLNSDVDKINSCYFDSVCGFYRVAVCFSISLATVIYQNVAIAGLTLLTGVVSLLFPFLFEKKVVEKQTASSRKSAEFYSLLQDFLYGFTTIRLFHVKEIAGRRMKTANQNLENANYQTTRAVYLSSWVSITWTEVSYILTIILGVWFCRKGLLSVGAVMMISQLTGGIIAPFEELPELISSYKSVKEIRDKLLALTQEPVPEGNTQAALRMDDSGYCIRNLSYSVQGKKILKGAELCVKPGEKVMLLGRSGSGKSTLVKLMAGFLEPEDGSICLGGHTVKAYTEKELYRHVTYLEQDIFLFEDTLRNNITMYKDYDEKELEKAVSNSGLSELIAALPRGLDTMVENGGKNFSGGEKQRIGIARALLAGSRFLLLDEMTTGLDPLMARSIEEKILSNPEVAVVLITHQLSERTMRMCDKIAVLEDGKITEKGSCDSVTLPI